MADSLATLGLIVDATGAQREIKLTTEQLKTLANGGKEASAVLKTLAPPAVVQQMQATTNALRQSSAAVAANIQAATRATSAGDGLGVSFANVAKHAEAGHLSLGRVNLALEGLAFETLGANAKLGSIGTKFAEFGVGGIWTGAILAGLAAVAFAWEHVTEETRKANEEYQKQIDLLKGIKREQDLGVGGEAGAAVTSARARLQALSFGINTDTRSINSGQLTGQGLGFIMAERDRLIKEWTETAQLVQAGEKKVGEAKKAADDDAAAKRQTAFDKEYNAWKEQINRIVDLAKNTSDPLAKLLYDADAPERAAAASKELDKLGLGIRGANALAGSDINKHRIDATYNDSRIIRPEAMAALSVVANRAQVSVETLTNAMHLFQQVTDEEAKREARNASLRNTATNFGLSLLSSTGSTGSILSGAIGAGLSASAGGPWAIAAAGAASFTESLISFGKTARAEAEKFNQASRAFANDFFLYYREAKYGPNPLDEKLTAAKQQHDQYAAQIESLYAGKKLEDYRNTLLHLNDVAYQRNIENIKKQTDALDGLSAAMLNVVDGYRLQSTIFKATTPRGGPLAPTLPHPYTSPGGQPLGDLRVAVVLDSQTVGSAVIRNFRTRSQAQTGDASNWTELRP